MPHGEILIFLLRATIFSRMQIAAVKAEATARAVRQQTHLNSTDNMALGHYHTVNRLMAVQLMLSTSREHRYNMLLPKGTFNVE